jgi:hypothetical protein
MQSNQRSFTTALVVAMAASALGSCSYAYDVRAIAIGGKLAFVSTDRDFDCAANVYITSDEAIATPVPGDQRGLVVNGGSFWWTDNPTDECTMNYPLVYDTHFSNVRTLVRPKKLKLGVVYEVQTQGHGAYGTGCFRISRERRIENLPYESCMSTEGVAVTQNETV